MSWIWFGHISYTNEGQAKLRKNKIYRPTSKFNIPSRQMRWAGFSGSLTFAKYLCGFSLRNQGHLWGDHHRSSQPLQDVEERGTESSCHQCQWLRYQGNLLLQAYNIITWCCPVMSCRHLMVCFFQSNVSTLCMVILLYGCCK